MHENHKENQDNTHKFILFTDIDKKNDSRGRPGKMNDRGLKKMHHRTKLIEHFLTDIMQISLTEWNIIVFFVFTFCAVF